jgi:hypothetical protein
MGLDILIPIHPDRYPHFNIPITDIYINIYKWGYRSGYIGYGYYPLMLRRMASELFLPYATSPSLMAKGTNNRYGPCGEILTVDI